MNDVWGEMELEMLRESVKSLDAERTTLIEKNRTMITCLNLMQGMLHRTADCYKGSHKDLFIELERLIKVGLNERSS